ncbi:tol-pal system YbgF family protein [Streptomyces sp. PU-14G]|uniref:tetratricopeptide repeat protein n=1 Tax=Streptomyces sp. PU-14G TaxID=2800808 RepID=UPI0034DF956B
MHPGPRSRDRAPNGALRALLEETEWTQAAFARALARLGAEVGIHLRYDRTSVAHWLRGSRPDPRVQHLMAEALSRRLGRRVTVGELGMRPGAAGARGGRTAGGARAGGGADGDDEASAPSGAACRPPATGNSAAPAHAFAPSGAGDAGHPDSARAHPVDVRLFGLARPSHLADQLTALTAPVVPPPRADSPPPAPYTLRLLTETVRSPSPRHGEVPEDAPGAPVPAPLPGARNTCTARGSRATSRTGPGEVASVHEHARFFARQADRHGGGHIRTSLAAFLSGLVSTLRTGEEGVHQRGMQAGAARLSFLLARVYADEQRHGLAQRAFLTAAELAEEAADPDGVALARRALSSQAHQLGHPRISLALAEAALAAAPADADPATRAFLYAGLAVAGAADGDRRRALEAMGRAERQLARAPADLTTGLESPSGEPVGTYRHAALLYQSSQMRAALGDRDGAIRDLRASLRARPADELRSRALCQAELAELLLSRGRLEEACTAWSSFLAESAQVSSGRVRAARARIPGLLRPYGRDAGVRALLAQASPPTGTGCSG